jgi:hypothetical protein
MIGTCRARQLHRLAAVVCMLMLAMSVMGFSQAPRTVLHNGDIVNLKKAGVDDEVIVLMIRGSATEFSNAPSDVIALKEGGVSNYLMSVMLKTQPTPFAADTRFVPSASQLSDPAEKREGEPAHPRMELFGGFSYGRQDGMNLIGWNGSVAGHFNNWFGVVGDFSGQYTPAFFGERAHILSYRAGPQFSIRANPSFTPFLHVLLGGSRFTDTGSYGDVATGAVGGGLDIRVASHVAIRTFQADYILMRNAGANSSGFRLSVGTVVGF